MNNPFQDLGDKGAVRDNRNTVVTVLCFPLLCVTPEVLFSCANWYMCGFSGILQKQRQEGERKQK